MNPSASIRILVADDDQAVLDTYGSILSPPKGEEAALFSDLDELAGSLFGEKPEASPSDSEFLYEIVQCSQGDQAQEAVARALAEQRPFSVAFLDVRMPPGPDGVRTAEGIRKLDPLIELVMVTGYSDLYPEEIARRVPPLHKLLYIQKPFHTQEIKQFAAALGKKWQMEMQLHSAHEGLVSANRELRVEVDRRRRAEAQYKNFLESSPDPVMVQDLEGLVTYLNPAFTRVFGWEIDEVRGRAPEFMPSDQVRDDSSLLERVGRGETVSGVESVRLTKDGRRLSVALSEAGFLDEEGELKGVVSTIQDITERKKNEAEVRFIAYHDTLTGLPNRKSFYECLEDELIKSDFRARGERRSNPGESWALLFMDLDKFKNVNDTLGHDAGDELLRIVGGRIKRCLRREDHLFRLGGDEFTIILSNLARERDSARVAEKIRKSVSLPLSIKGNELHISASIGISVYPDDGRNVETLVKNADMAMYAAKDTGQGYHFFTEEMNRAVLERMKLESGLRSALYENQFEIHYQQLVDKSHRIVGAEALLRWRHPEMGLVSPAKFIPVAEENGAIVPIGKWVLHTACRQARVWYDMGYEAFYVAVNLSSRQFSEPDLIEMVEEVLETSALPPHCLRLEVTESGIMKNPQKASKTMLELRERGIRFAIDDFGTGYSSLSYLKQFPVDALKIDRSFVKDSLTNKDDREIIKTIIAMAGSLEMSTVAEGVESRELHNYLTGEGCTIIQGFYHGRPVPAESFEAVLRSGYGNNGLKEEVS